MREGKLNWYVFLGVVVTLVLLVVLSYLGLRHLFQAGFSDWGYVHISD